MKIVFMEKSKNRLNHCGIICIVITLRLNFPHPFRLSSTTLLSPSLIFLIDLKMPMLRWNVKRMDPNGSIGFHKSYHEVLVFKSDAECVVITLQLIYDIRLFVHIAVNFNQWLFGRTSKIINHKTKVCSLFSFFLCLLLCFMRHIYDSAHAVLSSYWFIDFSPLQNVIINCNFSSKKSWNRITESHIFLFFIRISVLNSIHKICSFWRIT